jgi:hypothetical protein
MSPTAAVFWGLWLFGTGCAVGIFWRTRPWRHRVVAGAAGTFDARTAAVLEAVKDLPLADAERVLFHIGRLVSATEQVAQLWPDAERLGAFAAVTRAAQAAPAPPPKPRLLPRR